MKVNRKCLPLQTSFTSPNLTTTQTVCLSVKKENVKSCFMFTFPNWYKQLKKVCGIRFRSCVGISEVRLFCLKFYLKIWSYTWVVLFYRVFHLQAVSQPIQLCGWSIHTSRQRHPPLQNVDGRTISNMIALIAKIIYWIWSMSGTLVGIMLLATYKSTLCGYTDLVACYGQLHYWSKWKNGTFQSPDTQFWQYEGKVINAIAVYGKVYDTISSHPCTCIGVQVRCTINIEGSQWLAWMNWAERFPCSMISLPIFLSVGAFPIYCIDFKLW